MFSVTYSFPTQAELESFVANVAKKPVGRPPGSGKSSETPAAATPSTTAPPAATGGHTKAEATALMQEIRDKLGVPAAKEVLSKHGVAKLVEISDENAEAIWKDARARLDAPAPSAPAPSDDL